ncbi:MAG: hypothetical protein U0942_16550 [Parvibaculum sp.]|uniref:hypothetical protein n=1 Tax=Parvibaculum sp. TaxID=2024848 RepID=UPI002AB93D7C|nr:hypothetical protein [Parvibaculum sp.]MDZ4382940.1 hypothetical protein [Parvibaculum sp.]
MEITNREDGFYGIKTGLFDANNDGHAEVVKYDNWQGTMRGDPRELYRTDGTKIDVVPVGFEWKDYWTFGNRWVPYDGRFYRLSAAEEDGRYPRTLSYVNAANEEHVVCEFQGHGARELRAVLPNDEPICEAVEAGNIRYRKTVPLHGDNVRAVSAALGRWSTYARGRLTVDFDNDGNEENLLSLSFESGAGRGCTFQYFDLPADTDGGTMRDTLMQLQHIQSVDSPNLAPTCGGAIAQWFEWDDRVYLEVRTEGADTPRSSTEEYHSVAIADGGETRDVCDAYYTVRHVVSKYNIPLWE